MGQARLRLAPALKVFRTLMNDSDNLDLSLTDSINESVGIAGQHAFARAVPDTWPEYQAKRSDLLGLGQNGINDPIGLGFPADVKVILLYRFEIAPRACGIIKPLSGHGGRSGVSRSAPESGLPECCGPHPDRLVLRWRT